MADARRKLDIGLESGPVGSSRIHDSAPKHVAGEALYIDDIAAPEGLLHAYLGTSSIAHGRLLSLDLDAVRAAPGVVTVLTAADIPGANDISSTHLHDEPVFATESILFHGQPLFAVVAETREQARQAAALAKAEYAEEAPLIDIAASREAGGKLVTEPLKLERGDVAAGLAASPRRLKGTMTIGGQEHFYLESQIALAVPGEDEDMAVLVSTQHPSEVQHMVAAVLGVGSHAVTVEVRRMGGGFGGKETQANLFACVAALCARKLRRPVKLRPDRDDDMAITGKRHDFVCDYEIGFDDEGRIHALDAVYAARCGWNADLSGPVTDRAAVGEMLKGLSGNLDVIIPRGGKSLVSRVQTEARVPVFAHLEGICHLYIDRSADLAMARKIAVNAKMRRTGICGAAETLLVDRAVASTHLVPVLEALHDAGCEIRADAEVRKAFPDAAPATDADWVTEYLDAVISVKLVDGVEGAIEHIETYSSHHTKAIVAEDAAAVEKFFNEIDSAILLANASTQFADGGEFGMGAEIGIATGRMHARGPVGVEQLTSFKYRVRGSGQIRP